jgi:undecaprenyl-diphosphatase
VKAALLRFDHAVTTKLQLRPLTLYPLWNAVTLFGSGVVTLPIVIVTVVISLYVGVPKIVNLCLWGFFLLVLHICLKLWLGRVRPDTQYVRNMRFKTYSFPSGHTFGAFVAYGLLAYFIAVYETAPWPAVAIVGAAVLTLLVGFSRIYLGAHYVFDVLGGLILGSATLGLLILVLQ